MIDKQTFHPLNYIKKEEYSGSMEGMRYLLKKVKSGEADVIRVTVWPEPLGIFRTSEEKKTSTEVPLTAEGVEQAADWINEQYETKKLLAGKPAQTVDRRVIFHKININIWSYCGKCRKILHFGRNTVYNG